MGLLIPSLKPPLSLGDRLIKEYIKWDHGIG